MPTTHTFDVRLEHPSLSAETGIVRTSARCEPDADRSWVGNDSSQRNQNGVVRLSESPLTLALAWRASKGAEEVVIGTFRLDLPRLLAAGLVRREDETSVRVRFLHHRNGVVSLQTKLSAPGVVLGRV